jgi:hypothetical protein
MVDGRIREHEMRPFRRTFAGWCVALALFFIAANLAGTVKFVGAKPYRTTGFPFTVAAWGVGVQEFFDWSALALNMAVAAVVSPLVALLCAASRAWLLKSAATRPSVAEDLLATAARLDRAGAWNEATALYEAVLQDSGCPEHHEYARNCIASIERRRSLSGGQTQPE